MSRGKFPFARKLCYLVGAALGLFMRCARKGVVEETALAPLWVGPRNLRRGLVGGPAASFLGRTCEQYPGEFFVSHAGSALVCIFGTEGELTWLGLALGAVLGCITRTRRELARLGLPHGPA